MPQLNIENQNNDNIKEILDFTRQFFLLSGSVPKSLFLYIQCDSVH